MNAHPKSQIIFDNAAEIATFEIVMNTDEGRVTLYTDDLKQTCRAMDIDISGDSDDLPTLDFYDGPFPIGATASGTPVFRYIDNV